MMKNAWLLLITMTCIMSSCRTGFISDLDFQQSRPQLNCYYEIHPKPASFQYITPITASTSESVMVDGQWTTVDQTNIVGYGAKREEYTSFMYLMEKALNDPGSLTRCGYINVTRILHQQERDFTPVFSTLLLFVPNILGLPVKSNEVENAFSFEVYDLDNQLIHRSIHSGKGKAKCGFYYGFSNSDEVADFRATEEAIASFLADFTSN